jgi:hypothetical protein
MVQSQTPVTHVKTPLKDNLKAAGCKMLVKIFAENPSKCNEKAAARGKERGS